MRSRFSACESSMRSASPRVPDEREGLQQVVRRRSPRRRRGTRACRARALLGVQAPPGGIDLQEGVLDEMTVGHDRCTAAKDSGRDAPVRVRGALLALPAARLGGSRRRRRAGRRGRARVLAPARRGADEADDADGAPVSSTASTSAPSSSLGLTGATQGRYAPEQALLDITPGTRTSAAAYDPSAPPELELLADGRRRAVRRLAGGQRSRAPTAPADIVPGLLGRADPRRGGLRRGRRGRSQLEAVAAADRARRVARSRSGRRTTVAERAPRAAAAPPARRRRAADRPPRATRRSTSCCAARRRRTLLIVVQTPPRRARARSCCRSAALGLGDGPAR